MLGHLEIVCMSLLIFFFSFSLSNVAKSEQPCWIFLPHWKLKLRASCFIPNVGYIWETQCEQLFSLCHNYCSERAAIFIMSYCLERAAAIYHYLISFLLFRLSPFFSFFSLSISGPMGDRDGFRELFSLSHLIIITLSLFSPGTGILYGLVEGR